VLTIGIGIIQIEVTVIGVRRPSRHRQRAAMPAQRQAISQPRQSCSREPPP
jgi:hypothetical protein